MQGVSEKVLPVLLVYRSTFGSELRLIRLGSLADSQAGVVGVQIGLGKMDRPPKGSPCSTFLLFALSDVANALVGDVGTSKAYR